MYTHQAELALLRNIALEIFAIAGSGKALSPVKCQVITRTKDDFLIEHLGIVFTDLKSKYSIFLQQNDFDHIACKTAAILFRL